MARPVSFRAVAVCSSLLAACALGPAAPLGLERLSEAERAARFFLADSLPRPGCVAYQPPPPLSAAVDSARLVAAAAAVPASPGAFVVFSVRSDTIMGGHWVRTLASGGAPEAAEEPLSAVIRETMKAGEWHGTFRLRVLWAGDVALHIGPSVACYAQPLEPESLDRQARRLALDHLPPHRVPGRNRSSSVRAHIRPDGTPDPTRLVCMDETPFNDGLVEIVAGARFLPTLIDGEPVHSWIAVRLRHPSFVIPSR